VRASLGLASNQRDIARFETFAGEFLDLDAVPTDLPTRAVC